MIRHLQNKGKKQSEYLPMLLLWNYSMYSIFEMVWNRNDLRTQENPIC